MTSDPATDPDPAHSRRDDAVDKGQDLGRGLTEMAEVDMAAAGVNGAADEERRADG